MCKLIFNLKKVGRGGEGKREGIRNNRMKRKKGRGGEVRKTGDRIKKKKK